MFLKLILPFYLKSFHNSDPTIISKLHQINTKTKGKEIPDSVERLGDWESQRHSKHSRESVWTGLAPDNHC